MPAAPDADARAAFAVVRKVCRQAGGDGYLASFLLPRHKRDGVYAVWALIRLIEQTLRTGEGGCCSGGEGGVGAAAKARIEAIYSDRLELPLSQFRDVGQATLAAAAVTVKRFEIPRQDWLDLIDGWTAAGAVRRYATWASLGSHCAVTGGSAARLVSAVLGMTHSDGAAYAGRIGQAARLTAILRDLKTDLSHGRVYLPLEDLARFRYSEKELLGEVVNDRFRELMRFEVERARALYREGADGACWLAGDGSRLAASTYVALRLELLDEIERRAFDVFHGEMRVSRARQLRRLPDAWRLAKRQATEPAPKLNDRA
jgi:phytoene synthase